VYGPIETAILAALSAGGDSSPLLTLTAAEERCILAKAEELQNLLVKCPLGIACFQKQGSLAKGTAVPGYADVDIVVMFNKFTATALGRADLRKRVETALKNKESTAVFEGADDIVVCSYKDVSFDLILVGKCDAQNDARAVDFKKGLEDVNLLKARIGTNGFVLDVIRACKYWAKRSAIEPALKSVLIEKIVLMLWGQQPRAQAEPLAAVKQRLFLSFLEYLRNRVYAQKAGGAPTAATDLDVLLHECLPTLEPFSAFLHQVAATGTK
jgi:predicted nucleotidyltransferase